MAPEPGGRKDNSGIYHSGAVWTETCQEPRVSLPGGVLMNWPHFIVLIITEIREGNGRRGRSLAPSPACAAGLWCMICRVLWHCLVQVIFGDQFTLAP